VPLRAGVKTIAPLAEHGEIGASLSRMPLYEYRCTSCKKRVTILTLRVSEEADAVCDRCGGRSLERLMSRFAMGRSEESRLDALSDPSKLGDLDANDPASMARWVKRMGREMGEDVGGDELDQMADEMASGAADDGGDADSD
jgi:putative FmdB family regulatory protein